MAFAAKVVCDSLTPHGQRLTSIVATYPRFIHGEMMTHRLFSRNSASSRAIPWARFDKEGKLNPKCMKYMILNDPVIPIKWGREQKGMQSGDEVDDPRSCEQTWLKARDKAVEAVDKLANLGLHKSLCNRITEPWMNITVLVSSTDWRNFFNLRCHKDAEVHMQKIAGLMRDAFEQSVPQKLKVGEWHLPYIDIAVDVQAVSANRHLFGDRHLMDVLPKISAGRCARLSYLTHEDKRDIMEDYRLYSRLAERAVGDSNPRHLSPTEHPAQVMEYAAWEGNFCGFKQLRKMIVPSRVE